MSSLSAKDRVSLCSFTFSDGRRCRTPRNRNNPRFCFYHAQKEARASAADNLSKDLAHFFSGDYLSACDLSTALAHLIPAVVRGDVKPKTARTVAYLAQTLLQTIHISQDEYINTFGTDGWRKSIRNSVNGNYNYRFPPAPALEPPPDQAPHVVAGLQTGQGQVPQPAQDTQPAPAPKPAPSPHTSLPPTSAEFVQHVVAGLQTGQKSSPPPSPPQPGSHPADTPVNCHSERSEEPAFSSSPSPSPTSARTPQTPASPSHLNHVASTTDKTHPIPATQSAQSVVPTTQPDNPPRTGPSTPQRAPNRDAHALHFDHNCRLLIDGKPL
jgi:hypothetical protein